MKFKEFGWNGLYFEVPEEMRFSRQGGNAKQGHLMLEAEDYLIEAKWEQFSPKKARPLSEIADSIVKQMKEKTKKSKKSKEEDVEILRQEDTYASAHKALYMVVKSEVEERIYIWFCDESQRVMIVRFVFKTFDEASKKTVKRVFDTLKCHSEESYIYSLLNLRFEMPIPFLLTDSKITVGRAHFMFTDRKLSAFVDRTTGVLVEYFSMANILYKGTYKNLDKWLQEEHMKDLKKLVKERKLKFEPVKSTRLRRHNLTIRSATVKSGLSSRRTTLHTNASWYCSGTNRIYSVTVSSSLSRPIIFKKEIDNEAHEKLSQGVLSSFKCH